MSQTDYLASPPVRRDGVPADPLVADFAQLHADLRITVRRTVDHVLRDRAIADETVQDVFLEIWLKSDGFDRRRGNIHGWAATIARRRAIDRVRLEQSRNERERRRHERGADEFTINLTSEDALRTLDCEQLLLALGRLDIRQREAIVLAFFGDKTYVEVAAELGLPEGTVKRRIRDGLIKLRVSLDDRD